MEEVTIIMVHIMEVVPAPVQYHGTLLPKVIGILVGIQEEVLSTMVETQGVVLSIQVEIQEEVHLILVET